MKALVRLAPDITTKAHGTRKRFTRRTADNLRRALEAAGVDAGVHWTFARLYLEYDDPMALAVARRTFGVHSVSPCKQVPVDDLGSLVETGAELMKERVRGRSFAVRARVRDGNLGFRSGDVDRRLGAALDGYGHVNLDAPDVRVQVEVRDGTAYFFDRSLAGEGGLPVGVGGRAVVLLSGGFDSAAAAYLMMRRGIAPVFVSMRLGGDEHERALIAVANQLASRWAPGLRCQLWICPFEETVERLRAQVPPRLWQIVLKRLMYRVAHGVARRTRADGIVTGEALGQVSSQTLENLHALQGAAAIPVLRPLLAWDKEDIVALARHVGTHDVSARTPEYCALAARKPATAASPREVADAEREVALDADAVHDAATRLELPTGTEAGEEVRIGAVPEGATVLDLRSPPARRARQLEGAQPVEPLEVVDRPESLDPAVPYVVVCDVGARSAWLVRRLRDLGFQAWSADADTVAGEPGGKAEEEAG